MQLGVKVGKFLRATHEFSFALNTAFILGHHNSFLVSYHGKFPSGFAFFSYRSRSSHRRRISFFLYLVSLSGFSLSVSVVVAAVVVVVVGFENHNVFDVF